MEKKLSSFSLFSFSSFASLLLKIMLRALRKKGVNGRGYVRTWVN
ncbi:MAG: hypothetical protein ABIW38_02495 [Ferruginibacter sp.]